MKNIPFLFLLLALVCTDSEEQASTNLRKGDEFYNKGQYDIAEYYYDKIPEESILRKTVARRKKDIEKNIGSFSAKVSSEKKAEEVTIANHTFKVSLGRIPMHTITLLNSTSKKLQMVDVEFTYFNAAGN